VASEPDPAARVVVCAVDGSNADANAVEVATQLAVLTGARLALIAVAPALTGDSAEVARRKWTLEEALSALELTAKTLDDRVEVDCYVDAGNPVRRVVELATLVRALLLVVGTSASANGRPPSIVVGGLGRAAPCPVVVVSESAPVPPIVRLRGA
jgi:nucleotide-binding universal stress UspA family protein